VKITSQFDNDSPQLKELVDKTAENFDMAAVCGDGAYSSRHNLEVINCHGATPYIPFKSNATGTARGSSVWKKMFHYFQLNLDTFLAHYHNRSNAESAVQMIKSKFGARVRSKTWTAQVNEVLCKIICHNICVVIQEMHELGIDPDFNNSNQS
jgi:transposase